MVSEASAPATDNPVTYIQHHLTNLCVGCDPETHIKIPQAVTVP